MKQPLSANEHREHLLQIAKRFGEAFRPKAESRKDFNKTLISVGSAMLVFTITFSTSLVTPGTPRSLRYAIAGCWLLLACALTLSFLSLWYSTGFAGLELFILSRGTRIEEIVQEIQSKPSFDDEPWQRFLDEPLERVSRHDKVARRSFGFSLVCYGAALLLFTYIGLRQLFA